MNARGTAARRCQIGGYFPSAHSYSMLVLYNGVHAGVLTEILLWANSHTSTSCFVRAPPLLIYFF